MCSALLTQTSTCPPPILSLKFYTQILLRPRRGEPVNKIGKPKATALVFGACRGQWCTLGNVRRSQQPASRRLLYFSITTSYLTNLPQTWGTTDDSETVLSFIVKQKQKYYLQEIGCR